MKALFLCFAASTLSLSAHALEGNLPNPNAKVDHISIQEERAACYEEFDQALAHALTFMRQRAKQECARKHEHSVLGNSDPASLVIGTSQKQELCNGPVLSLTFSCVYTN